MSESKRNTVSVKIYIETHKAMEAAKERLPKEQRPDFADIIEPAIAKFLEDPSLMPKKPDPCHEVLDGILAANPANARRMRRWLSEFAEMLKAEREKKLAEISTGGLR